MPRWPSDWLGLSPEASHTARVAGSHRTNGFGFSNTVELYSCVALPRRGVRGNDDAIHVHKPCKAVASRRNSYWHTVRRDPA
ncbi:hypothetical protein BRM28_14220 [Xanthomonas oryzae pv. oryzae]|nr:hypothetical protein BRM28_14220 [Xanthomonas oryzae pv. oryzae]